MENAEGICENIHLCCLTPTSLHIINHAGFEDIDKRLHTRSGKIQYFTNFLELETNEYIKENSPFLSFFQQDARKYVQSLRLSDIGDENQDKHFKFSHQDTIVVIPHIEYEQNKRMHWEEDPEQEIDDFTESLEKKVSEERKVAENSPRVEGKRRNSTRIILDRKYTEYMKKSDKVKHFIRIPTLKGLYTKSIRDKLLRLYEANLGYGKHRRRKLKVNPMIAHKESITCGEAHLSDELDEESGENTTFSPMEEYKEVKSITRDIPMEQRIIASPQRQISRKQLIGYIVIQFPQINSQNEETKSQGLISSINPTIINIYNVSIKEGQHKFSIKSEVQVKMEDMQFFIAPTILNIYSPTFWLSSQASNMQNSPERLFTKYLN